MPLPNFLIIGAGRSGTTSLHAWLRQHPQVFMSPVKEPNFFVFSNGQVPSGPGSAWLRATSVTTRAEYEALFADAGDARAIGEASPRYLNNPESPARIQALLPSVRLVAILRHPVERAFANYLAHRRDGYDPAPTFEAALDDQDRRRREGGPFGSFIEAGKYWMQLSGYMALFPPAQMKILLFDDLLRDPVSLVRDLLTFLDVDPSHLPDTSQTHGRTGVIRNPLLRVFWRRTQRARMTVGAYLPITWRHRFNAWAVRDQTRPEMRPETRARLLQVYRDDTLKLQDLLGRDLSAWLR